jgi:HEAT repeat protein
MVTVDKLIRQLGSGDKIERRQAARALRDHHDPRVVDALLRALIRDNDPRVREEAASSLKKIRDPKAIPVFVDVLVNDPDPDDGVRQTVIFALEEFADDDSLRQDVQDFVFEITEALRNDKHYMVRAYAARTLGKLGDPKAVDTLHEALDDPREEVRFAAVSALGKIGTEDAIESLIYAMENYEIGEIRFNAAKLLNELGAEAARSAFIEALGSEDSEMREIAARALGKVGYGEPDAVDRLINTLESDSDEDVRVAAAESLAKLDDPYALPPLGKAAEEDRSDAVRDTARQAYHALFLRSADEFLSLPGKLRHALGRELQEVLREHFVKTLCEKGRRNR